MNNSFDLVNETCNQIASVCKPGVIIPLWYPLDNLTLGDTFGRAFVYALGLIFCFLGVSIISDQFMGAIEVITSQEKEIHIVDNDGNKQVVMVRYWNETVSNLTLMALGSSAPEILLSVIEIFGNRFEAGDLGPNTIVGSAAYNLFVIIGYVITVVPEGEVRRIKHLRVFFVTASWSIFAYIWLYLIIAVFSRGEIEVWEGVLTFLFFPITVLSAYIADQKIFFGNFLEKKVKGGHVKADEENGQQMSALNGTPDAEATQKRGSRTSIFQSAEQKTFEDHRNEYINILKEMRQKFPDVGIDELQNMAEVEILQRGPKSRAFYRMSATRKLVGGNGANIKKKVEDNNKKLATLKSKSNLEAIVEDPNLTTVSWDPSHYTCFESVGKLEVFVSRSGGDLTRTLLIDYKTENGTAEAGTDFDYVEGTLVFGPNELKKSIGINIIDDDVYEEDEQFNVRLSNARFEDNNVLTANPHSKLKVYPDVATVMILDDDHNGIFVFPEPELETIENVGTLRVKVSRTCGARGKVKLPFKTVDGTALSGKDYIGREDMLTFYNNEIEKYIDIEIFDDEDYEKNECFYIELGAPIVEADKADETDDNEAGKPKVGEVGKVEVQIRESKEIKGIVDKLLVANTSMLVGTTSWREQFSDAFKIDAGGDDEEGEEGAEPASPSWSDYVIHYVSLFWKVLFAFCPPTDILGGWACFWVSMGIIGALTALIGDLASFFGCTVGLKDSVTAISFVALGTSLPDTFASKVAAQNDKYADGSVGNVTGSNAVNVFLGIGIAWTIAAIYHAINGTTFVVEPGSLGFSVTIFCCFAFFAIALMMFRRFTFIGAELGGPMIPRYVTSLIFFSLWLGYVSLSTLESYCYIQV